MSDSSLSRYYFTKDYFQSWQLKKQTINVLIFIKGPKKCVGLYRMLEYSGFILVNRNNLGPSFFVRRHMMSENSGVGLHKFHCNYKSTISFIFQIKRATNTYPWCLGVSYYTSSTVYHYNI
jgi:hypothetical protein